MSSVPVVVIVVVVIAAIAAASIRDERKPPTRREPPPRDPVRPYEPDPSELAFPLPGYVPPEVPEPEVEGELDDRSAGRRVRSLGLLVVTTLLLGSLAAALIGVTVLIGYELLDRALG